MLVRIYYILYEFLFVYLTFLINNLYRRMMFCNEIYIIAAEKEYTL